MAMGYGYLLGLGLRLSTFIMLSLPRTVKVCLIMLFLLVSPRCLMTWFIKNGVMVGRVFCSAGDGMVSKVGLAAMVKYDRAVETLSLKVPSLLVKRSFR